MRTYDDTFGGTKIYPGKVSNQQSPRETFPLPSSRTSTSTSQCYSRCLHNYSNANNCLYRASSSSAATAKSSAFKMANPNPSSSSERTPAGSHGRLYSDGNTRRASQRSVRTLHTHTYGTVALQYQTRGKQTIADHAFQHRKWRRNARAER